MATHLFLVSQSKNICINDGPSSFVKKNTILVRTYCTEVGILNYHWPGEGSELLLGKKQIMVYVKEVK